MKVEAGCYETGEYNCIYAGFSDKGCVRKKNEDDFLVTRTHNLFAVADGVGGLAGGDLASKQALTTVENYFNNGATTFLSTIFRRKESVAKQQLKNAIEASNQEVYQLSRQTQQKIATTLIVLSFDDTQLTIGHVGDSRGYLFRHNKLTPITTDHTVAQELASSNTIISDSRFHNIITRAVGAELTVRPDFASQEICDNDMILLCSDGLTSMVSDQRISEILLSKKEIANLAKNLIDEAKKAGGKDNVTVILLKWMSLTKL